MAVTLGDIVQSLQGPNGVLVLCLVILWMGMRGQWVWGREMRRAERRITELARENQELRQVAFRQSLTTEEARVLSENLLHGLRETTHTESESSW